MAIKNPLSYNLSHRKFYKYVYTHNIFTHRILFTDVDYIII